MVEYPRCDMSNSLAEKSPVWLDQNKFYVEEMEMIHGKSSIFNDYGYITVPVSIRRDITLFSFCD